MEPMEIIVASPYYEEDLIAEISYQGRFWAIVKWKDDRLVLETVTETGESVAVVPLSLVFAALTDAQQRIHRGPTWSLETQ